MDPHWLPNHLYIAYNDLAASNGETASVLVSTNGGSELYPVASDRVGSPVQDAPSVRLGVDGSTVYAAFTRWTSFLGADRSGDDYYAAQVVVVRSDNGGADGLTALGASGNGVEVAAPTGYFSSDNSPASRGQERTASARHRGRSRQFTARRHCLWQRARRGRVPGDLQPTVAESTDGGATWITKFTTSATDKIGAAGTGHPAKRHDRITL